MNLPIQYGLDVTVSLSVIGAALAYVYSRINESNKAKKSAMRQKRIDAMSKTIENFSEILNEGSNIVSLVHKLQRGHESNVSVDDFLNYCEKIDRYILVQNSLIFEVWANDEEKEIINNIRKISINYQKSLLEALLNKQAGKSYEVPDFLAIQADILHNVKVLSTYLRNQVEDVIA